MRSGKVEKILKEMEECISCSEYEAAIKLGAESVKDIGHKIVIYRKIAEVFLLAGSVEQANRVLDVSKEHFPDSSHFAFYSYVISYAVDRKDSDLLKLAIDGFYSIEQRDGLGKHFTERRLSRFLSVYSSEQESDKFDLLYQAAIEKFPDNIYIANFAARNKIFNGEWEEGFELLRPAIEQGKYIDKDLKCLVIAANAGSRSNVYSKAVKIVDFAINNAPENNIYYNQRADIELRFRDFDAAREFYYKAMELDPEKKSTKLGLAKVDKEEGLFEDAVEKLSEIVSGEPHDPYVLAFSTGLARQGYGVKIHKRLLERAPVKDRGRFIIDAPVQDRGVIRESSLRESTLALDEEEAWQRHLESEAGTSRAGRG